MTSILSSIPGHFGKSLILGALLPTTIFIVLTLIFVVPIYVDGLAFFEPLQVIQPEWQALAVLFLTVVLTGLLHNLNVPIIRLYEGYPWKDSLLGRWRTRRYQKEFDAAQARLQGMFTLRGLERDDPRRVRVQGVWSQINLQLLTEYPERRTLILPTKLGNIIRSFERYPSVQYGIDSIAIWPRLIAVVDKEYTAAIDDARISLSFMLNSSLLSAILTLTIVVAGLLYPPQPVWLRVVVPALVFAVLACCFYLLSIGRAKMWGDLVKGAFDLYRWNLLKKLGYQQEPKSRKEERALWKAITLQTIYADKQVSPGKREPRVDYVWESAPPSPARTTPDGIKLELARGVQRKDADGTMTVVWGIRNVDTDGREAEKIVLTDTLPDGFDYEWESASADGRPVRTVGMNPYDFHIDGALPSQIELVLAYRAIPRKTK